VHPSVAAAVPAVKFIGYAGLTLILGPALLLALLWPRRLSRRGPILLVRAGLVGTAAATLGALWTQAPNSSGAPLWDVSVTELADVLASPFGLVLLARLAVLGAAAALLPPLLRGRGRTERWRGVTLVALTVAGLTTWPLTGHAAESPLAAAIVAADVVHIAAMAVWLGGLVTLAVFLLRGAHPRVLGVILPAWSRWAMLAVVWLVGAGTVQAVVQVGSVGALWSTGYGRLVVAKVAVLAGVLVAAAFARKLVHRTRTAATPATATPATATPAAATRAAAAGGTAASGTAAAAASGTAAAAASGTAAAAASGTAAAAAAAGPYATRVGVITVGAAQTDAAQTDAAQTDAAQTDAARAGGIARLRRTVGIEVAATVLVLGLSAVLVQVTPGRSVTAEQAASTQKGVSQTLTSALFTLQYSVYPVELGENNTVHGFTYTPQGKPLPAAEWTVTTRLRGQDLEPVSAPMLPLSPRNDAIGALTFPLPGTYEISFTVRVSDIDQATVKTTITVPQVPPAS
jgi:copper transport protein